MNAGTAPAQLPFAKGNNPSSISDTLDRSRFRLAWQTLWLTLIILLLMLAQASWKSWAIALENARLELEQDARINALPVALGLRDARRLAESIDARLPAAQAPNPAELRQELNLRFRGREVAEWVSGDGDWRTVSTSGQRFDAQVWRPQIERVRGRQQVVVGWAYPRDAAWFLPVFYRRADGSLIVVSLPTEALFAHWTQPKLPGQSPLGLRGPDDRILWHQPFVARMLGSDASQSPSVQASRETSAAGKLAGSVMAPSTETDQVLRLIAWADVAGSDIRVTVATARANVEQHWLRGPGLSFGLMALLLLCGFGMTAGMMRRLEKAATGERRLQRAAQRQGDLVRQALDASRDTTWQLDLASGIMRFDADLRPLLCADRTLPEGAPDGVQILDLEALLPWVLSQDRPDLRQAVVAAREQGTALHLEVRTQGPDGTRRHFLLKGACASDPDLAVGTLRDITRLAESQAQVADTLETLHRMCRLARIGYWTADPATGHTEFGPGTLDIYGLPADAAKQHWLAFRAGDASMHGTLQAARQRLLTDGTGYDLMLPITAADGSQRWVRSTAMAHRQDGQIDRVDGAVQDVTPLVLAQRRIDSTESRLRELALVVESSSQMLLTTDPEERIIWCNEAFERVSGYRLAELRGQRPGTVLQRGAVPAAVRERMRHLIDTRSPLKGIRLKNFSKAGSPYWVDLEVVPVYAPDGKLQSLVGLQTDVTADIEREQVLAHSKARYELATRNARIGVWEFDFGSKRRRWNAMMYELAGLDALAKRPSRRLIDSRLHPDDVPRVQPSLAAAARNPADSQWSCEFRWQFAPGDERWMRAQCQFERDTLGGPPRAVGTLIDITAERVLSQERQARAEADARDMAKTAFISSMSHELRTPLNAVLGYAQILLAKPTQDAAALRERVQRIEAAGWHLVALIDDILDLARIEAGNVVAHPELLHLGEVVADSVDLIAPAAEARGIQLDTDLIEVWVDVDRKQLRQVMANLLSNAVKYNREGGKVQVRIEATAEQVLVQVQDTGLGMSAEQLAGLYQPFNRLGRENSQVEGTGIGLTITLALVQRMGGVIEVASQPQQGTLFTIKLPRAAAAPTSTASAGGADAPLPAGHALQVLCVEDNPVNALLFEESLHLLRPAWAVRTANSAAAATSALQKARCDLVFLDHNLPDMSGLNWMLSAQAAGLIETSQVVLISADALPELRQQAQAAGIQHHLSKPFRLAELRAVLSRLST